MVRIKRSYRIQVCGTKIRPTWRAPLGFSTDRQIGTDQTPTHAKSPIAVHRRSACSGVKALRNTSAARRQAAKLCYRFGPLTPPARSPNLIAGDGTKNGFPAPNKEPAPDQKRLLDRKSPIQVRILFPPARSQQRTWMSAILPRQSRVDTLARTRARLGLTFWLSDCLKYTGRCCI
jgi:hypothetical protein